VALQRMERSDAAAVLAGCSAYPTTHVASIRLLRWLVRWLTYAGAGVQGQPRFLSGTTPNRRPPSRRALAFHHGL
jgi:hypothetical protein